MSYNGSQLSKATEEDCQLMLQNFIRQQGDKGAKLLSTLKNYIQYCGYKFSPVTREDQQEILQEIAIKILNKHKQLKGNCSGWLFMVVRNEYIDLLRRSNNQARLVEPDSDGNLIEVSDKNQSGSILPEKASFDMVTYNETDCLEHVFSHIEKQPTGTMDMTIYTGYAMGKSNAEIAEQTGRSSAAIGKRICNLRKRVKELRQELC